MDLGLIRAVLAGLLVGGAAGLAAFALMRHAAKIPLTPKRGGNEPRMRARARMDVLASVVGDIMPMAAADLTQNRSALARSGLEVAPSTWWAVRILAVAGSALLALIAWAARPTLTGVALATLIVSLGVLLPQVFLLLKRRDWRSEVDRQLPDAMDLMAVAVSAGSSLPAAMRLVSEKTEGALARGFRQVIEQGAFSNRTAALMDFARRCGSQALGMFSTSVAQAERSGAPLAQILTEQSEGIRRRRRLQIEEEANKATVKMLIPMIFFMLPAALALIISPFLAQAASTFAGIV